MSRRVSSRPVRRPVPHVALLFLAATLTSVASVACGREEGRVMDKPVGVFNLASDAFAPNQPIPAVHAHPDEGENRSPALAWADVPQFAAEIVLIVDDPDAAGEEPFVHWLVWGLRADVPRLPDGLSGMAKRPATFATMREGVNGFGVVGWSGPLPPAGHGPHRYRFTAYALRSRLDVPQGATKAQLLEAMVGKVVGTTELVGTYERFAR